MASRFRLRAARIKISENHVESACKGILALRRYKVVRLPVGLFKTPDGRWQTIGEKGMPDYVCVHAQHPAFFLEVKRPGGVLSTDQLIKIAELQMGYHSAVAIVDSVEALAAWLAKHEA